MTFLSSLGSALGSAAPGIGAAGGSLFSSFLSYKYQKKLQKQNQDWQERMSNTAHQREVSDLISAGLNPVLSANQGGADYGSVGNGTVSVPDLGQSINSSIQLNMQRKLNEAQVYDTTKSGDLKAKQWDLVDEQSNNAYEEGLNLMKTREYIQSQIDRNYNDIQLGRMKTAAEVANLGALASYYTNSSRHIGYGLNYDKLGHTLYGSKEGAILYALTEAGNTSSALGRGFSSWFPKIVNNNNNSKKYYRDDHSSNHYDTFTGNNSHSHYHDYGGY